MQCDQLTVAGFPCRQKATWTAPDRKTGEEERYCTQHASYYGLHRRKSARKLDKERLT